MYEETIAGLRKIVQDYKGRLTPYMRLTICEAADAIDELDTLLDGVSADNDALCETIEKLKKPRWIPVTERLPEEYEYVLVTDGERVSTCFTVKENGRLRFYSDWSIAHWMPLPEPPKEATDEA